MPAVKQGDFDSLTKEELELKKLRTEVFVLQKETDEKYPQNLKFYEKFWWFIKKTYLKISGIAVAIFAIYSPITNYIATQRRAQLSFLGSPIWKTLDSANNSYKQDKLDQSVTMEITTQDPNVLAPILLEKLNDNSIDTRLAGRLYIQMYKNTDFYHESFTEKLMYLFVKKNKAILEDELNKYAKIAFTELPINKKPEELTNIVETYLDIIYELKLSKKSDFPETLSIIDKKCETKDQLYVDICDYKKRKAK